MYRLSLIISEIYNKYLPLAEKNGISLNLDFSDTTKQVANPEQIKQYLDENLSSALKRSDRGDVNISVDSTAITVTDTGTTLSKSACALLSNRYIQVSSRVGFGTTVKIFFKPQEQTHTPTTVSSPSKPHLEGASFALSIDSSNITPTIAASADLSVKDSAKPRRQPVHAKLGAKLRLQRKTSKTAKTTNAAKANHLNKAIGSTRASKTRLDAAAKKADKEMKRIAKKAKKAQKTRKTQAHGIKQQPTKTAKGPSKKGTTKRSSHKKSHKLEVS